MARARLRGIKQRHPLGSVPSRSGVSLLTAESGITTSLGVKISALPAAGAANDTDQLEVNQGGTSRRITIDQLAVAASSGTVTLLNRIAELEGAVATLLDHKAAVEKERDALKAEAEKQEGETSPAA